MKLIDPEAVHEFVPKCDRELSAEEQAVFLIRPLTFAEQKQITNRENPSYDQASKRVMLTSKQGDLAADVARAVITGWRNVRKSNGEDLVCERSKTGLSFGRTVEAVTEDCIGRIPWDVIAEIYRFAMSGCELTEDDAGNS